jgi:ribonuclease Z
MPEIQISFLGTGSGNSTSRAHTAIALHCSDGTRLLLDAGSGNSALRNGGELGIAVEEFDDVLLTHHHPDHMAGLLFVQFQRTLVREEESPVRVHSTDEALEGLKRLCLATRLNISDITPHAGRTDSGREVLRWHPTGIGDPVDLGPRTTARPFLVDHIDGSIGWRVESDGISVVFSGDTRFSPGLVEASQGADLLIHEAYSTDENQEQASHVGHSTAAEAGRAAAQAGVSELVLTHITNAFHANTQALVEEASTHFNGPIRAVHDLMQVTVLAR